MTQEQIKERILGIINHENQKILNSFAGAASYTSYKKKAATLAQRVFDLLYQPYILKGFVESIASDQPYFSTLHMFPLTSDWGNRVNSYNLRNSETILESAHAISGGALKWNKYTDEDTVTIFLWIDPEVVQAGITKMEAEISRTFIVGQEDSENPEAEEEHPEDEIPHYN